MADLVMSKYGHKLLNIIKDLPFWLLSGIAIIAAIMIFLPLKYIPFKEWWSFSVP